MNTPSRPIVAALAPLALLACLAAPAVADDVAKAPAYDQFVVIPLRIHVLTSKTLELADATITDAEAAAIVPQINAIWDKAGIRFGLESVVREPAAQVERFQALLNLNNGQFDSFGPFGYLLPASSRASDGFHVYIFRELAGATNSVYLTAVDATLIRQDPVLRQVVGGTKDTRARVAARCLGWALGLTERQDEVGLLSGGTNGVGLSEDEIARARQVAKAITGAFDVAAGAKEAEAAAKKGDIAKARRLYTWLADVPGAGAEEARKRLKALDAKP